MIWILISGFVFCFLGIRAYLNNARRWAADKSSWGRLSFFTLQAGNVVIASLGIILIMLMVTMLWGGLEVTFTSNNFTGFIVSSAD